MEFLSRFAESDFNKYGRPCFRWGWWFYRQLALLEFRIGALEYETTRTETGARALSLHIPAGADLSRASLCASLRAADAFFAEFFPQFDGTEKYCDSWLLSPVLPALLPQDSHILQFQSGFEIVRHDPSSSAALDWIFPNGSLPPERLPEGTLLQKKVKAQNKFRRRGTVPRAAGAAARRTRRAAPPPHKHAALFAETPRLRRKKQKPPRRKIAAGRLSRLQEFSYSCFLYVRRRLTISRSKKSHCACTATLVTSSGLDSTCSILSSMMLRATRAIIRELTPLLR